MQKQRQGRNAGVLRLATLAQDDSELGGGDGARPVLRGEIGREGFASGMQGTGIREQARTVRERFASEWLPHTFPLASKLAGDPDSR